MSKIPEAQKAADRLPSQPLPITNTSRSALLLLGTIAYSSGKTDEAQFVTATDLARSSGMENLVTQGLLDLNSFITQGSFAEAESYVSQALTLAQTYREKRTEARANLLLDQSTCSGNKSIKRHR
jgi:hypothetical protein